MKQSELFREESFELSPGSDGHQCGTNGIIKDASGTKHCIVCGRAISIRGSFVVADLDDTGHVSRSLAETRLQEIHRLTQLLYGTCDE